MPKEIRFITWRELNENLMYYTLEELKQMLKKELKRKDRTPRTTTVKRITQRINAIKFEKYGVRVN